LIRIRGALSNINIDSRIWIGITTCLCFVAAVFNTNIFVAVSAVLVLLAALCLYRRDLSVKITGFHIYILIFAAYTYLSAIWAADSSLTIQKGNGIFFIFILMLFVTVANPDDGAVDRILKCLMYGGYIVAALYVVRNGVSGLSSAVEETGRVSNEVLNANMLGMVVAYAVVINLYYIFSVNKKLKVLDLLILPALLIIYITSSRKALIIIIAGVLGLLIVNNIGKRRRDITLVKWLIILGILAAAVIVLTQHPAFSGMWKRVSDMFEAMAGGGTRGENSAWLRARYAELGMQLFADHPIGGVGIANSYIYTMAAYGKYHLLHNNFVEMLGCGGIIGFTIYYSIYAYIIGVFIKYRKYRTQEYGLCFLLLIIWLAMDAGAVKYFFKNTYFYLLLFWFEAEKLKRNARRIANENVPIRC